MKEYIMSRGWKFVGTCGCTPKMDEYANSNYTGWQIKLGTGNFVIREKVGPIWHTRSNGSIGQLENIYNQYFK